MLLKFHVKTSCQLTMTLLFFLDQYILASFSLLVMALFETALASTFNVEFLNTYDLYIGLGNYFFFVV